MYSDSHTNKMKKTKQKNNKMIHHKTTIDTSLFLFENMEVKTLQL
jgi:hypothetical protein